MTEQIPDRLWVFGIRLRWFARPVVCFTSGGDPFELQETTACWRRYVATYHMIGTKVYLLNVLGGRVERPTCATWLSGRYVVGYRHRSFELILDKGCLRRFRVCSSRYASQARPLLGDPVSFPGPVEWRTQAVLDRLRGEGVSQTEDLMRIWGFGPHEWQGCHDLMHSWDTPGAHRIARKVARKMGLQREEADYRRWELAQMRPGDVRFAGRILRATDDCSYEVRCRQILRATRIFWKPIEVWSGTEYQTCFLGRWLSKAEMWTLDDSNRGGDSYDGMPIK